jgi:hypothetical protein
LSFFLLSSQPDCYCYYFYYSAEDRHNTYLRSASLQEGWSLKTKSKSRSLSVVFSSRSSLSADLPCVDPFRSNRRCIRSSVQNMLPITTKRTCTTHANLLCQTKCSNTGKPSNLNKIKPCNIYSNHANQHKYLWAACRFDPMETEKLGYKGVFVRLDMIEIIRQHCKQHLEAKHTNSVCAMEIS